MRILVASDSELLADEIRQFLLDGGHGCTHAPVFSLDRAVERVVQVQPQGVVLVIPPEPEHALAVLQEIQETAPIRVLAVGPANDPKLILRALHQGAYCYIDQQQFREELRSAFRRLQVEAPPPVKHGRIISVLGSSGGSGASTVAVNVATCLAQEHRRCALLDLKLESGDLAALLDLHPAHTVADFCRHAARMDASMFERCFAQHSTGVHLLAAPPTYDDRNLVTPRGVRKALVMARGAFPYVVVDLERSGQEHVQALYQSDLILVVMRLDFVSVRQTRRILDYLESLQIDSGRVHLAVNRHLQPQELRVSDVEQTLKKKVRYFIPDDPKTVNQANNRGVPVVLEKPRARVSRSLHDLAQSVNGRHQPASNHGDSR